MCRRCLEALTKSLGAQGRNLQDKLDSLKTTGHVDSRLVEWAHSIRILGNEAAHDTDVAIASIRLSLESAVRGVSTQARE